jgi:hypothetical protein
MSIPAAAACPDQACSPARCRLQCIILANLVSIVCSGISLVRVVALQRSAREERGNSGGLNVMGREKRGRIDAVSRKKRRKFQNI